MTVLSAALTVLLAAIMLVQMAVVVYLLVLTVCAVSARPRVRIRGPGRRKFAVLVPAHNEEAVINRLLASLDRLAYQPERFEVCVVADNCDDTTAAIARSFGARVYERFATSERAKGYALRWLLDQLRQEGHSYDAFVIVDADSIVAPNFLQAMDARLEAGAQAIQAYYTVLNPADSAVAGLRAAALAAVHYLRPLGRSVLGLSAGLKGNGMCFTSSLIETFAWSWFTLAEDVEFHLALVKHGIAVDFASETWVKGDMPVTLNQAASQNARWERGRLDLVRNHVPRLLWSGLRRRKLMQIDAAVEQLIPPLSVPFAVSASVIPAALFLGNTSLGFVAAACLAGYVVYLSVALVLTRAPVRIYLALATAPVYIAWKIGLYARSLLSTRTTAWVRTARTPSGG